MSKNCQNCGSVVSDRYARVSGDNNGKVWHCIECIPEDEGGKELLRRGAPAFENLERAKERLNY